MTRAVKCAAVLCIVSAGELAAQQQQGDKELGLGGSLQYMAPDEGDAMTSGTIFGSLGMFMTRNLKLSVGTGVTIMSMPTFDPETFEQSSETTTSGVLQYQANYYFGGEGSKTYPYLGVGGTTQFSSQEDAESSTNFSGIAGLQHYFSRNAAGFAELSYTPQEGMTLIPISFGFRYVF